MTFVRFLGFGVLSALILSVLKILFFGFLDPLNIVVQYLYWFLTFVVVVACSRRLGFINYLEAVVVLVIWLVIALFFDLLIASQFLGLVLFKNFYILFGYLIMALAIFMFHKKRHVQIRRQQSGK